MQQPGKLLFQTAGIQLAAAFDLAHEFFELAEFLRDGCDEFADALAGARGGAFAQFVFRTFEQRFDGRFAGALRFGQRRAQRRRLGTAGEPQDRAADGGAGDESRREPRGRASSFQLEVFLDSSPACASTHRRRLRARTTRAGRRRMRGRRCCKCACRWRRAMHRGTRERRPAECSCRARRSFRTPASAWRADRCRRAIRKTGRRTAKMSALSSAWMSAMWPPMQKPMTPTLLCGNFVVSQSAAARMSPSYCLRSSSLAYGRKTSTSLTPSPLGAPNREYRSGAIAA